MDSQYSVGTKSWCLYMYVITTGQIRYPVHLDHGFYHSALEVPSAHDRDSD